MTDSGFIGMYTIMARIVYFFGLTIPGIENKVPNNKVIRFIAKYYNGFLIGVVFTNAIDSSIMLTQNVHQRNLSFLIKDLIHILYDLAVIQRLYLLKYNEKLFADIVSSLEVYSSKTLVRAQKVILDKMSNRVNRIAIIHSTLIIGQNLFFTGLSLYRFGYYSIPSTFKFDHALTDFTYSFTYTFSLSILACVYFWIFTSVLISYSAQLSILRMQLGDIFSTIEDRRCLSECRGPFTHKEVEDRLGDWIKLHVKTLRCFNGMNKIFRTSVLLAYGSVIVLMTSLISTSLTGRNPLSIIGFSVLSLLSLFWLSDFGNKATEEWELVTHDVLDKPFYLYPKKMQKSIVIILIISQQPKKISFLGIYPLSLAVFYSVLKIIYSVLSILSVVEST